MRQFLKQGVINKIRDNEQAIFKIATALNRRYRTVIHWLSTNDIILTTSTVLAIIREETGLDDSEILEAEAAANSAA